MLIFGFGGLESLLNFIFYLQMCAGAVVLTDCVFWLILYPFLTAKDYDLDFVSTNLISHLLCCFLCLNHICRCTCDQNLDTFLQVSGFIKVDVEGSDMTVIYIYHLGSV